MTFGKLRPSYDERLSIPNIHAVTACKEGITQVTDLTYVYQLLHGGINVIPLAIEIKPSNLPTRGCIA